MGQGAGVALHFFFFTSLLPCSRYNMWTEGGTETPILLSLEPSICVDAKSEIRNFRSQIAVFSLELDTQSENRCSHTNFAVLV